MERFFNCGEQRNFDRSEVRFYGKCAKNMWAYENILRNEYEIDYFIRFLYINVWFSFSCFLSSGYSLYFGVLLPIVSIIVLNMAIFIIILVSLARKTRVRRTLLPFSVCTVALSFCVVLDYESTCSFLKNNSP